MAEALRFCMVTTFYPPWHFGGDAIFVGRLAGALAAAGHRVDVVHSVDAYRLRRLRPHEADLADHPNLTRIPLESASPRFAAGLAHQLGRPALYRRRLEEVLDRDYDVIHFHNVSLMGAPEILRRGRALKLYTAHEYWLVCPTHALFAFNREACTEKRCFACTLSQGRVPQAWRGTARLREALEHVDTLLFPSRFALERHRAEGITRPLELLPHFVPEPEPPRARPAPRGRPFFLYAGRIEKLKGVQDLLGLFASERRADLVIAGDGSYRSTLERQARGLPQVQFRGHLDAGRLAELYRDAVALVVPSLCYETFGLSAAEAMSHGTPVLVRRIGALGEMIEQSGAGFAFDRLPECAAAMDRLLREPDLRASLGRRGVAAVRERWSLAVHLERYLDLVRSRLARRRGAPAAAPALVEVGA